MSKLNLYNGQIIVNINNLLNNINYLKNKISKNTLFMAVVKANAYGHGINIINYMDNLVDYYGVANILEGLNIRKITDKPILILGNSFEEAFLPAHKNNIILTIGSIENFLIYKKFFDKYNIRLNTHLKIDTGMGRVGILPDELDYIINEIKKNKCVYLSGVFTHLAESENLNKEFTNQQISNFLEVKAKLENIFPNLLFHCSNSSAILQHENSYFNMVRAGISVYGIGIPYDNDLKQLITLKSRIISIKELPENYFVGYNLKFKTNKKTKIAIIPLGYADGIPRIFSNNLEVLIKNNKCPIIGNISMDQITIDISNINDISITDEVILINSEITIEEWAIKSNRSPYEVLCSFGNRIERVYEFK